MQEIIKKELCKLQECEFEINEQTIKSVDELETIIDNSNAEKYTIRIKPTKSIYGKGIGGRPIIIGKGVLDESSTSGN